MPEPFRPPAPEGPPPARRYTAFRHPMLAVPCPSCAQPAGSPCLRPGGRRAVTMHVARRCLMQHLFRIDHGEEARLVQTGSGWIIEPAPPAER